MKITEKQKRFADLYLKYGDATKAYAEAYNCKNRKTAKTNGHKNLQKPTVSKYIESRLKKLESERIADIKEVMEFYTKTMRGEVSDQFGLDCCLSDRIKAATELAKRLDAQNVEAKGNETIKVEILTKSTDEELVNIEEFAE